jgi:hypothetical protein
VGMTEVKRTTIETVHGTYAGWYWPKVADPRFKYFQHSPDIDFDQNPYRVASAPTGFEQPRTRSQYPVFLNLDAVLGTHMNAVFKQLAYGLWLQSANRFIHDPVIRAAVDQSMGHEYTKQLEPWLRDQIFPYNPSLAVQSTWQQVGKHLRRAAQVTWLGFSVKTGISQTAGLIASADMIGETWVARGLRDFAMSIARNGLDEDIFSKSEIMRMRQENPTRDTLEIMEQHKSLTKGSGNFLQAVASGRLLEASDLMARASLHYIGVMDFYGVSGATWLGARAKYISENVGRDGVTLEVEAARYADKIVEQSQGTGFAKDMGALERDKNEWARWMTMFNTWPGRFYNLEIDMLRDFAQGRHRAGMHKAALLFPVNAVLTSLLGFAWPDKKHRKNLAELAKWIGIKTILAPFGGVPIVRDISSGLDQHFTGGGGDMIRGGETYFSRMADNLNKTAALFSPHHKKKDRDIATAIQTTGLVTGLIPGAGQIGNTAQGIANLPHAKKDPETITKELIQGRDAKAK